MNKQNYNCRKCNKRTTSQYIPRVIALDKLCLACYAEEFKAQKSLRQFINYLEEGVILRERFYNRLRDIGPREAAKKLGVNESYISRMLSGKQRPPAIETILKYYQKLF